MSGYDDATSQKFPQLAMALQNHARIDWLRTIISHTHAPLLCIVAPYIVMNSTSVIASVGNVTIQSSSACVWLIMSDALMYRFVSVVFTHVQFGENNFDTAVFSPFL